MIKYLKAQDEVYTTVVNELRNGKKETHWMWFVFPQIDGLGNSEITKYYSIKNIDEAIQYLNNPILRDRLFECCELLLNINNKSINDILGFPDDLKLQSSATLFSTISPSNSVFHKIIEKYFNNQFDKSTLDILSK